MVHVNKLRKTIERLEVKCKNAEAGCSVTYPLAYRKRHQDSCPFELITCPSEGCSAQVLRGALAEHQQHCHQGGQHCPLGCGAMLGTTELAHYNCYLKLREAWSERQERSQMLLHRLLRRVRRVHRASSLIRRQLAQLSHILEDDSMRVADVLPEGSVGAHVWEAQGQDALEIEG
ncbi:RING finger protein 151 [Fukomys damarensis]|uniref:RING finger protein 151 n=2 Tax=Fukomys damarensis TaxID=885580 RepID=A0A091DUI6_FUKDA|nr:RING finger protein 151 [Fukomys damarensis]